MPRSFLVKSVRCEKNKTSNQKLRELYAETAAVGLKAAAPYTPTTAVGSYAASPYTPTTAVVPYAAAPHSPTATTFVPRNDYSHGDEMVHLQCGEEQTNKMESNNTDMTQYQVYASEPTDGVQSRSPDASMQPRGFTHTLSPRDYPPKKRLRYQYYDVILPPREHCHDVIKRSHIDYDDITMRSRDHIDEVGFRPIDYCDVIQMRPREQCEIPKRTPNYTNDVGMKSYSVTDDVIMRSFDAMDRSPVYSDGIKRSHNFSEQVGLQMSEYVSRSKLETDDIDYMKNNHMRDTTNNRGETSKICLDFNSNIVSQMPTMAESDEDVKNTNLDVYRKRTPMTIDYTIDAFLVSDGRSKRKSSSSDTEKSEKPRYTCSECGKQYATSSNLSRHKQTHRSLESKLAKKCPHCDKVYVSMPALSMHVLTHELRHTCHVCHKAFSRPWLLQGHLRSHTGERPYGCAHCGKAFADRSNLRAHMQTHSAFKNFACERCDKTFALKSYLNKHYESACIKDELEIESELNQSGDEYSNDVHERIVYNKEV